MYRSSIIDQPAALGWPRERGVGTSAGRSRAGPGGRSAVRGAARAGRGRPGGLPDLRRAALWARELAAYRLGLAGDRRAFESLVLLLNHRDPPRCEAAAQALAVLGDPRTARAAAALATNELRTAYALHPVRLLAALRAPESAPALIRTLSRLLAPHDPYWRVALACVEGLGALADQRAREVLTRAQSHPRLAVAATAALRGLGVS